MLAKNGRGLESHPVSAPTRRDLLKMSAVGALLIGVVFQTDQSLADVAAGKAVPFKPVDAPSPDAFVRIGRDSEVTVVVKHLDKQKLTNA